MDSEKVVYSSLATSEKVAIVSEWLTDKKAEDLLALDLVGQSNIAESLIIVTATSIRHAQGLADSLLERCRESHFEFLRMEGYAVGHWILLDMNDILVHIFQTDNRDLYKLNDLWPHAEVMLDKRQGQRE